MATRIYSKFQSTILFGAVLLTAPFTSVTTCEANTSRTDETTCITIAKGQFVTPPEIPGLLQSIKDIKAVEADNTGHVNVMSAPSEESRTIAELKNGQPVQVLKAKDSWLKITWQINDTLSQGWLDKSYVEGKAINARP